MKLLLVMADAKIHCLRIGTYTRSFREAPLTLTTLAALVPDGLNADIVLVDESVERVNFDKFLDVDLVGISALTGTAVRAYEIADYFRKRAVPVVFGGIHVSIYPEEAADHADAVVTGFAEETWPRLLLDFNNGRLKERYDSTNEGKIEGMPVAKRDLQRKHRYMMPNTVMATRGCTHSCDFCSVPVMCKGYYKRPVEDVVNEIETLKGKRFAFNDVSIAEDPDYAKALFKALIPLKKIWGGLATINIAKDLKMIELLRKSGCKYLLIGFESFSQNALKSIHKGFNRVDDYSDAIKKLHDAGIIIQGCFVFGFDHDDRSVFEMTVDKVNELKIDIPRYAVYTPYPETILFKRLKKEGRILTKDWSMYDTQHVVFRPALMSPEELYNGFRWAFRETFKVSSIVQRTFRSSMEFPITFIGNLAYKIYIKRLYRERIPQFIDRPAAHGEPVIP